MQVGNHPSNHHALYWANACQESMQRLHTYAMRLANGRSYDAEDLVQETICRALTYSKEPESIRNPLGYLLRMLRSIWITKWHKENTANMKSLDELQSESGLKNYPAVEPDVFRILENEEFALKLKAIPGPLTAREKELLKLYLEAYSCKEMAELLNEDVRVTRYDLNAVKNKLKQRIKRGGKRPSH